MILLALAICPIAQARSPDREIVPLTVTWDVGYGTNVHAVGSSAELGNWSALDAIKLRWTDGNVWTGQVAVPRGMTVEYKFIARCGEAAKAGDPANVVWEPGTNRVITTAVADADERGKTVYFYSTWTSAALVVVAGTNATTVPMAQIGPGRTTNEFLYKADHVGRRGELLEFVPNGFADGESRWDNPEDGGWNRNYCTPLDTFLLQDGQTYDYWPAPTSSAPRVVVNRIQNAPPGFSNRTIHVYLPRGYEGNASRRYPVLYMHDGQNVFDPGGEFGSWSADAIATREMGQGRMRECIIVGVDNSPRRRQEYEPPGDRYYTNEAPGAADAYLKFLTGTVKPAIDRKYRTLAGRTDTFVGGSSMGGLVSLYCGYESDVFGGVLAMSPSVTRATNYVASLGGRSKPPLRIYMDTGTDEGNIGPGYGNYWEKPWEAYDLLLERGFAPNGDLMMRTGYGDGHNEAAWRKRLPVALRFLLDPRDEEEMGEKT